MIDWPEGLIRDIARRRSVLFLGAGVSKNSTNAKGERPVDWDEFLKELAVKLPTGEKRAAVEQCIAEGDLLTACEVARKALKADVFKGQLLHEFSEKRFQPASVHKDIVEIDSRIVLTSNVDKIYDAQANAILHGDVLVKNYYDSDLADILRRQQRCILKVHGTIDTPEQTVFTRSDYAAARIRHQHFYRVLEALFMTHTFVFLGASMRDPDIRLILEDYAYRYSGSTRPHYMVMPSGLPAAPILEVLEESMNLRTIAYDPAHNHRALAEGLAELKDLVGQERSVLRDTLDW